MENSITLQDVAKLAGVSIGTASQALNNRPNVAQDTRMRVVEAARTLGYPIKETSNGTGENPMSIIGLLIKHNYGFPFEVNAFYSYIQAGVESECRRHNLSLMFANIEVDPANHPVVWPSMITDPSINEQSMGYKHAFEAHSINTHYVEESRLNRGERNSAALDHHSYPQNMDGGCRECASFYYAYKVPTSPKLQL